MESSVLKVSTSSGQFDVPLNASIKLGKGDKATFVVSGDRVNLANERPMGERNCVEVSVVGEEFVGATGVVHMEGSDGIELKAQKSHVELERINTSPGAKVWFSWPTDAGHILPGE